MRRLPTPLVACALGAALLTAATATAQEGNLRKAFKREYAFLEAEKATLKKRLAALDGEAQGKRTAARSEIDSMQGQLMAAALEAERLNEMMYEAERAAEGAEDGADAVQQVLDRVHGMLESREVALPAVPDAQPQEGATEPSAEALRAVELERLQKSLAAAVTELERSTTVRRTQGTYFGPDGEKVEGAILHVGNVASYGLVDGQTGALAPAGGGRLKVWDEPGSPETAAAFAGGESPSRLRLFLYETLDNGVEKRAEKTALSVIESGGVIAWVIVALGGLALLMILLRAGMLFFNMSNVDRLVAGLEPLLERGEIDKATEMCRRKKTAAGRVLRTTLRNLERDREHLEDIISEAILHETPTLDRFGSAIMVLAAVAPLLGLLGTVTGMISTFDVITEFGTGNPKLLSGGISEALVTTELGLIVAIPSLLLGNMLAGWADSIKDDMDKSALRVTNVATGIRVSRYSMVGNTAPPPVEKTA